MSELVGGSRIGLESAYINVPVPVRKEMDVHSLGKAIS